MKWFDKAGLVLLAVCVAIMAQAATAHAWIDLLWWLRR